MVSGPVPLPLPGRSSDDDGLTALRARYPGWDIQRVFGGYEAVPAGTPVIRGAYLETIAEKLSEHDPR